MNKIHLLLITFLCFNLYTEAQEISPINQYSLQFDGIDDFIQIAANDNYEALDEMTISMWVKRADDKKREALIDYIDSSNTRGTWAFRLYGKKIRWFMGNKGTYNGKLKLKVDEEKWEHIAFVYSDERNTIEFYKNGAFIAQEYTDASILNAGTILRLGNDLSSAGSFAFRGAMDEVQIWNKALTPSTLNKIMYHQVSQNENIIAYWNFEEGEGELAIDHSKQQNNGFISGAVYNQETPFDFYENEIVNSSTDDNTAIMEDWGVELFPNPATDKTSLLIANNKLEQLEIFNVNGQLIERININGDRVDIDLSEYQAAYYLIKLYDKERTTYLKLLVEK